MTRRLLALLVLFTLGSSSLRAQESLQSATFKQRLRAQYLQNDTAQAIITLYGKRQAGGAGWIVGAALAAVRVATAPTTTTTGSGYVVRDNSNSGGLAFVFAAPFAAYGVGKILHYSNGHLEKILADYAAGQPLARSLRRKLKPRFFAQPIIQYQSVPAAK